MTRLIFIFPRLNQTYRQLLNDNELLTADHKQLKSQLNEAKLEHTWLDADFSKLKKEFQQLDITSTKLTNQCEVPTSSTDHFTWLLYCLSGLSGQYH